MIKKRAVAVISAFINRKKSNLKSFKLSKSNFKSAVDKLPKGDIRKKGGNLLSRNMFADALRSRLYDPFSKATNRAVKNIKSDLSLGGKSVRKLKKMRKNVATGRSGKVKFIRVGGRVIPIRARG